MAATKVAIEWLNGGLDAAFALAKAQQRPLFLYWGAAWCPPCNRVKSEIFARDEFAARTAGVLCYHLDGDSAGAQALAARYQLRSYPTLVLYAPDGGEITRLPCELDGELFVAAFDAALAVHAAGSSAAAALEAALSVSRPLSADEWSLLSHYSWDTDEGKLLGTRTLAPTLAALAAASTNPDAAVRLQLHAQLAAGSVDAAFLLTVLADARLARSNMDIFNNSGLNLIKIASRREELAAALGSVAAQWADDFWLSAPDRLMAVRLQMRLARLLAPTQGLQEQIRERVDEALAESTDPYERHTLVNTAVSALNDAGLPAQAEQVLLAELPRSHSPYYFMLSLAASAKRRNDVAGVLDWYGKAWQASVGVATRLQWGVTYLNSLIDLAPQDSARIEQAAQGLLADIHAAGADAHQQRNLSQLQKLAPKLASIPAGPHTATLAPALTPN
jgi:thiol-disulfide isomerase/thioredoxin